MSRILADKVTNYNNDGPFEAEKGINIPIARPLQIGGNAGISGQYLTSTGAGLSWQTFPSLFSGSYNDLTNKPSLFSGSYNDLSNKPAILNIDINLPQSNQYLKYDGNMWINTPLPPIYEYNLSTSFNEDNNVTSIVLSDQFFEETSIAILGNNGITVTTTVNGDIVITSPTVSEYNANTAKDNISEMFLNGTNSGISYTYNATTKTINSSVSLAEQLVYTLNGSSEDPNTVKIYLDNGTIESGFVNLVGTNGIDIAWNIGTSTISFSKTDPTPYVLPAATTTTLGGIIPDSSDFNIDGLGNLTVNFPASGIDLTDLSIATEGVASGNGNLSYDNTTGQFTYTPPSFSIDDLNDVSIVEPAQNQILMYMSGGWQNSTMAIPEDISDLGDVVIADALIGEYLVYNGTSWVNSSLDLSSVEIEDLSNVTSRVNDNPGQILIWKGTNWEPSVGTLFDFDVDSDVSNGQTLVWNSTTSLWEPTTIQLSGANTLDELTDVNTTGLNTGDFLSYTGTFWTPTALPNIPSNLKDLIDVSSAAPTNGYVLTWNSTALEWEPAVSAASPGAGLTSRNNVNVTTTILNAGENDAINFNAYKSYSLFKVQTSAAAWVTLYCDAASRAADTSRLENTPPAPGSGVIADVVTTGAETFIMTPAIVGFNNDTTPSATIYAKVVNKSGLTQAITVTLTVLQLEA